MIYCCYHQKAPRIHAEAIRPIQAGRACAPVPLPMIGDETGDSLSARNRFWCELTVLYWIRRNTTDAIAGLVHYRRLLNLTGMQDTAFAGRTLDAAPFGYTEAAIRRLLTHADIILPKPEPLGTDETGSPRTVYRHYAHFHRIEDLETALQVLEERHPEMMPAARRVIFEMTSGHWGNLFLTTRPILEAYADWLFGILFEVERRIQSQVEMRAPYQQRVYGFLAERLFNVWLAAHPELRILEVPTLLLTADPFVHAGSLLRHLKGRCLTCLRRFFSKK